MKKFSLLPELLAAVLALALTNGLNQQTTDVGPAGGSVCPDAKSWTGKYTNHSYGFAIVIPSDLKGFWNSAGCVEDHGGCTCMSDHGRIVPLDPGAPEVKSERYIEVYAGYAAHLDSVTVPEAVKSHMDWIRERSRPGNIRVRKRISVSVAGLKGEHLVVRYLDAKSKGWMVEDFIELLREDIEYDLYLRTPRQTYEHDRSIFNTMVASFVLTEPEE